MSFLAGLTNAVTRVIRPVIAPRPPRGTSATAVQSILVIELWNIGDLVLAMPFLTALRHTFPHASITLLAKPIAADLLAGTGLVDRFIHVSLDWTGTDAPVTRRGVAIWRVSRQLRRHRFDLAFSARHHLREHLLLALSGARRRIGFGFSKNALGLTDSVAIRQSPLTREREWMLLLEPTGITHSLPAAKLCLTEDERDWARDYLRSHGVGDADIVVGVHPGASQPEKRWPIDRFCSVADELARMAGVRLLAFAEPPPSNYGAELFQIPNVIAAQTSLRQLMALIDCCAVLVCNDSGPMHIAGALGVRTVAMFGAGIGARFSPLGTGHRLLESDAEVNEEGASIRSPLRISVAQARAAVIEMVQHARGEGKLSAQ